MACSRVLVLVGMWVVRLVGLIGLKLQARCLAHMLMVDPILAMGLAVIRLAPRPPQLPAAAVPAPVTTLLRAPLHLVLRLCPARQLCSLRRVGPMIRLKKMLLPRWLVVEVLLMTWLFTTLTGQRILSMTWPPLFLVVWVVTRGVSLGTRVVRARLDAQNVTARLDGKDLDRIRLLQLPVWLIPWKLLRKLVMCPRVSVGVSFPRLPLLPVSWLTELFLVAPSDGCGQPKLRPVLAIGTQLITLPSSPLAPVSGIPLPVLVLQFLQNYLLTTGLKVL